METQPEYYFPQLRVALCLECSKLFEEYRRSEAICENFLQELKRKEIEHQGYVDIRFNDRTVRFTGKHLAEIQEILRQKPT